MSRPDYAITTLTTVGYGDRTRNTDGEKMFSILAEIIGRVVFEVLAGTLVRAPTTTWTILQQDGPNHLGL